MRNDEIPLAAVDLMAALKESLRKAQARREATPRPPEVRPVTGYEIPDGPKMLRETLCVAQSRIGNSDLDQGRKHEHIDRLQRLIDACDGHRPLGPDGKHGNRHTPTCGC